MNIRGWVWDINWAATLLDHFRKKNVKKIRTLVDWYEGDLISYFKSLGFNMLNMLPLEKEI